MNSLNYAQTLAKEISVISHYGLPIVATVYFPVKEEYSEKKLFPAVIFAHGFKGFKDWGGFPYLLDRLAKKGFVTIGFNFSHNGITPETPCEFSRPDLFAMNTISKELDDLNCLIDYVVKNSGEFKINNNHISLIGHSRGGGTSIIKASEDSRVKSLITLASVAAFDRYTEKQKSLWREKGYLEVPNVRTGQIMRMNLTYLEDLEKNHERLDICKAVKKLKIPFLIIHGREDLSVRYTDAEILYSFADKKNAEIHILENTGHTFGTEHPFKGTTPAFEKVIDICADFLLRQQG
jgi:dipeptidyl aminopeptidase/acylaminoacyl peptidase